MRLIKSTPKGKQRVYDIEVADVHNFYANGVNVHNCATDGGVSVIKDDGNVVDLTYLSTNAISRFVDITSDGKIRYGSRSYSSTYNFFVFVYKNIPSADTSAAPDIIYTYTTSGSGPSGGGNGYYYLTTIRNGQTSPLSDCVDIGDGEFVISTGSYSNGGQYGIHKIVEYDSFNSSSVPEPLVAIATTSFNTGWMHGDIKGAFLSDTDATNLVATDLELITNGSFSSDSDWTKDASWTISGGNATNSGNGNLYQEISVVSGRRYLMTATFDFTGDTSIGNTSWGFRELDNSAYYASVVSWTPNAVNQGVLYWTSTVTGNILARCFSQDGVSIDNWSVQDITDGNSDRSVNGRGLQVFGTITKSAVA